MVIQREKAANLSTQTPETLRRFNYICYDDDDDYDYEVSAISLNKTISQEPLSIANTPVLPTLEPEDSLIMDNQELNTIPKKESDEFIKSSVGDLVLIPSESEDTSGSDSDDVEFQLHHDPSIPKMSVASILEGFTDEPPLEENDDLFDLKSKNDEWKKIWEQMLLAMKDEAGGTLNDEENDFMLDNAYGDETLKDLTTAIVDSGCSKHMTSNLQLLRNFVEKFMRTVCFRNDHFALITGYRDYVQGSLMICHVYYVEGLRHNLFSVRQFFGGDQEVAFRLNSCHARNSKGEDLLTGSRNSNLYTISIFDLAASSLILNRYRQKKTWIICLVLLYEEYYVTRTPDVSNDSAINTLGNKDTPLSSSIIIEEDEAPQIVTSSEELVGSGSVNLDGKGTTGRVTLDVVQCIDVAATFELPLTTIGDLHKLLMILKLYVDINTKSTSYAGAAGASEKDQPKVNSNFRTLVANPVFNGVNISIPRKVVEKAKHGLKRIMMNSKGFFFFKFDSRAGLEAVLEGGPWLIHKSPIILKKWSMDTRGWYSLIATFIGKPVTLDSYTSSMCNESWGRSSFACFLIEVNSKANLVDVVTT
nr:zinc knuckle CX2CX4HX4C [Tanacetum cinerariifolium]